MIRSVLLIVFVSIGISASPAFDQEWESFKLQYGKIYDSVREEVSRRSIFIENLNKINLHNGKADKGFYTYRMGINKFTDKTPEEFKSTKFGLKQSSDRKKVGRVHKVVSKKDLPESIDWRPTIVTQVKDQGECGSCYAFSTIAALESASAQKTGKLVEFSEQNLLDCSWKYGDEGCLGGYMTSAFEYVKANKGIDTEACYPYTSSSGNDTQVCSFKSSCIGTSISDYVAIPKGDENALLSAVAQQVVTVSMDQYDLHFYKSGIIDSTKCIKGYLNHGVAAVGYGTENGTDYWILKNSAGKDWGESGYFRMVRGKNMCGIAEDASYPII